MSNEEKRMILALDKVLTDARLISNGYQHYICLSVDGSTNKCVVSPKSINNMKA